MSTTITLTPQELANVLVGLRMLQESIENVGFESLREEYPQIEGQWFLGVGEINELCERINTESVPEVWVKVERGCVVEARASLPLHVDVFDMDSDFDRDELERLEAEYSKLEEVVY